MLYPLEIFWGKEGIWPSCVPNNLGLHRQHVVTVVQDSFEEEFPIHAWHPRGPVTKASSQISFAFSLSLTNLFRPFVFSSDASFLSSFREVFFPVHLLFCLFTFPSQPRQRQTGYGPLNRSYRCTTACPFAAGMPHRKPLATLDPQSAHTRLTEDMSNSPSSSRLSVDPKDAAANCYGRQIVSRGSIGDEDILVHSTSSSRKNSLAQ